MRTFLMIGTAILLISLPATAYETRPFLGLNLQLNSPTGDFGDEDLEPGDGGAEAGGGVEVDIGLAARSVSAYFGLRAGSFDIELPGRRGEGEWKVTRLVLGIRGNLSQDPRATVVPTIGAGVTVGRTGLEGPFVFDDGEWVEIERESETSIGWFIEGGVLAHLSEPAALVANVQYHTFEAEFDDRIPDEEFDISFVTIQVGVRIMFGGW